MKDSTAFPLDWNVPFLRNPNFTGCQDVLTELRSRLGSGQPGSGLKTLWVPVA